MYGIKIEAGVNDCHWNIEGVCTHMIECERLHIMSRRWDSKENCTLTQLGVATCHHYLQEALWDQGIQTRRRQFKRTTENEYGGGQIMTTADEKRAYVVYDEGYIEGYRRGYMDGHNRLRKDLISFVYDGAGRRDLNEVLG